MSQITAPYISTSIKSNDVYIHNEVTNRFDKNYVGVTVVLGVWQCGLHPQNSGITPDY